jgi:hypothetical protein
MVWRIGCVVTITRCGTEPDKWRRIFGAIWPGPLDARSGLVTAAAEPSDDSDDERFACCLDDFLGDDREVVDV